METVKNLDESKEKDKLVWQNPESVEVNLGMEVTAYTLEDTDWL